jgi:hypothetical protein
MSEHPDLDELPLQKSVSELVQIAAAEGKILRNQFSYVQVWFVVFVGLLHTAMVGAAGIEPATSCL